MILIATNWPRRMWYSDSWQIFYGLCQIFSPRNGPSFYFSVAGFTSLSVKAQVIRDRGLSNLVIPTLPKARK